MNTETVNDKMADNINEKNVLGSAQDRSCAEKLCKLNGMEMGNKRNKRISKEKWMGISWFRFRRKLYCQG